MPVEILEHQIEQALRQVLARGAFVAEAAHEQYRVQAHEFEPPVAAVGYPPLRIEHRLASLVDQGEVKLLGRIVAGTMPPQSVEQSPAPPARVRGTLGSARALC